MLIELHLLTPHAPSNLNRDDFGRPKTALFGGTERGRISSQALKRAIRKSDYVAERLGERISTRSLHIPQMLYDELKGNYDGERLERLGIVCEAVANGLGKAEKIKDGDSESEFALKTSQIVFLTQDEIRRLRQFVKDTVESDVKLTKAEAKRLGSHVAVDCGLDKRPTDAVDMALFGRMTTDTSASFSAVDAAMQVAHPIATHTTITETDYFTAVDDWKASGGSGGDTDTRGSGHIGEIDFNSAVYYKYFSCDTDALIENMGGDIDAALSGLEVIFEAACRVSPSGKQNSFASHSPAEVALLVIRRAKTPCSLAGAFEAAVPATEEGYMKESMSRMLRRYGRLVDSYGLEDRSIAFTVDGTVPPGPYETAERLADVWTFLRTNGRGA